MNAPGLVDTYARRPTMRTHPTSEPAPAPAAAGEGKTPGHRSLTQQLQRRRAPGAATPAPAPAGSGAFDLPPTDGAVDDPFGLHLGAPVQRAVGPGAVTDDPARVQDLAAAGVAGAGGALPHADAIQRSFGPAHDVGGIGAFVGGDA